MNENKAELDRQFRLPDTINEHEKALVELKSLQLVGAENIKIAAYPISGAYEADVVPVVAGGQAKTFIQILPSPPLLANWQVRWSWYVGTDNDPDWLYGSGINAASGNANNWLWGENYDWLNGDDSTGKVQWNFWLKNNSPVDQNAFLKFKVYGPEAFTDIVGV